MAAEKKNQQQQQGAAAVAAAATEPSVARRLWRVVRAVLYMLRRGLPSGRKLAMDLHLLLHRGKIMAGKALGDRFLASDHHGRHGGAFSSGASDGAAGGSGMTFSCGALDPRLAVHEPSRRRREVEFSCSNTPSSATGGGGALGLLGAAARRRRRHRRSGRQQQHLDEVEAAEAGDDSGYLMPNYYYGYDAAEVARVFELLSDEDDDAVSVLPLAPTPGADSATPSSSPALLRLTAAAAAASGTGSRHVQQRGAVSPSPAADGGAAGQVDRRADEFIRRFYEQLRAQRSAASTPDYYGYGGAASSGVASPYVASAARTRTPRSITAGGIA